MNEDINEKWVCVCEQLPGIKCFGATKEGAMAAMKERATEVIRARREGQPDSLGKKLKVIVYENRKKL